MTIVDYFDPRIYEHLEAWRKVESVRSWRKGLPWIADGDPLDIDVAARVLCDWLPVKMSDYNFPKGWGPLIISKMADAWLEQHLGAERVAGDLRVPRLRRGGGETPR